MTKVTAKQVQVVVNGRAHHFLEGDVLPDEGISKKSLDNLRDLGYVADESDGDDKPTRARRTKSED